jgi:phospholipid transport system substrate-binding protein
MSDDTPPIGRRGLVGLAIIASVAVIPWWQASAETSGDASASVPIEQLDNALIAAMKAGSRAPFDERYNALAPVIEQVFDLDAVLAASIGLPWATLPAAQKTTLDYVMRRGPAGWQAVDVLTDGSISRVAVQRADFRGLLSSGGAPALVAGLEHKVANLSGGTPG